MVIPAFDVPRSHHRGPPRRRANAPTRRAAFGRSAALVALSHLRGLIALAVGSRWFRPVPDHKADPARAHLHRPASRQRESKRVRRLRKVDHALDLADSQALDSTDRPRNSRRHEHAASTLDAGSRYLLAKLAEEPATPPDLATAVRNEANAYQEVLIGYLDGLTASDPECNRLATPRMRRRRRSDGCANDCARLPAR